MATGFPKLGQSKADLHRYVFKSTNNAATRSKSEMGEQGSGHHPAGTRVSYSPFIQKLTTSVGDKQVGGEQFGLTWVATFLASDRRLIMNSHFTGLEE